MSITRLPSGKWRAQVHNPSTGRNVSVSKVLGGPGTFGPPHHRSTSGCSGPGGRSGTGIAPALVRVVTAHEPPTAFFIDRPRRSSQRKAA